MTTRPKINVVATLCRRCDQFRSFRAILMNASALAQSVSNDVAGGVANAARPARFRRGRLLRTDGAARTAPSAGGKGCGLPGFAAAGFARRQRGISNRATFRFRAVWSYSSSFRPPSRHSGPPQPSFRPPQPSFQIPQPSFQIPQSPFRLPQPSFRRKPESMLAGSITVAGDVRRRIPACAGMTVVGASQ